MEQLKQIRDKTGCGISDCKNALDESGGDLEKAIDILRKSGIAKAAKRSDREACEGVVIAGVNDNQTEGYMVEVNSETDFVAKNEKFQEFASQVFSVVKEKKPADRGALLVLELDGSSIKEQLETLSGTIGEKLDISNVAVLSNNSGTIGAYVHGNGRIGVLVSLSGASEQADLTKDIAMQVAAANPKYVNQEDVPAEEIAKEKDIYREQLKAEGKPENIIDKIVEGKMGKFYEEVCLVNQPFIRDDKKKVEDILSEAKVEEFVRFAL